MVNTRSLLSFAALCLVAPFIWSPPVPVESETPVQIQRTESSAAVGDVVSAANAFLATLSATQQATVLQTYNQTNVTKWSNLPISLASRIGIRLSTLTTAQQAAALAVVQAAMGTGTDEGYDEVTKTRLADDYLNANGGGSDYGQYNYFLAFLGQPSTTGTWQLQFGGHHLAVNITYEGGEVAGGSPSFRGLEPLTWTSNGTTYAPLNQEHSTMLAMLSGLSSTQQTAAKLTQTFSDILLGPNANGQFPATKVGLACSTLTASQKQLVLDAMATWVRDIDDSAAQRLMDIYTNEIDGTYIAWSGHTSLDQQADYVRIDGPSIWIELVCQGGIVFRNQIHYHTIWRDHYRDYGGNYYVVTGIRDDLNADKVFSIGPNPVSSGQDLTLHLAGSSSGGSYILRDALGRLVGTHLFEGSSATVSTASLAPGPYMLSVQTADRPAAARRIIVQ